MLPSTSIKTKNIKNNLFMDEASVEQAIKDKLNVDERLLKRLIKASQQIALPGSSLQNESSTIQEEFQNQAQRLEKYTQAAVADVEYFEGESIVLRNEFVEIQANMTQMRTTLQTERDSEPLFTELRQLHVQLKELGERDDLNDQVQREEAEIEKLRLQIQEEEAKLSELKRRLQIFLEQFRTNE